MADFKSASESEKQSLVEDESYPNPASDRPLKLRERVSRPIFLCFLLLLLASFLLSKTYSCHRPHTRSHGFQSELREKVADDRNLTKVALEAHIMSKCPDAKACLELLVVPTMAQVSDLVDFKLSYIGTLDPRSDEVHCMHGPTECLGNIIQLCAAYEYPSPIIYLGFANCMTSSYSQIPQRNLIKACALEHGIDFQRINDCISDERKGMQMLRQSVQHSQDVHVSTSCTVRLEEKVYCVRDGGKWKDCPHGSDVDDLVTRIETLFVDKNLW